MWGSALAVSVLGALLAAAAALPTPAPTPELRATVHVNPPPYPPARYNYTERWHTTGPIPSPFSDGGGPPVEVRYATSTSACGMLALIADPQVGRTLWEAAHRRARTYNATVVWYKIESGCARPLYYMEYTECDPRKHFGYCRYRTPPFWTSFLAGFAYPTDDELGLIMAAPARLAEGQYRRALYIDGAVAYTDFMVSLPAGDCWFSKLSAESGYTFSACFSARDYERGEVLRLTYLIQYYPQEAHKAMVDYWFARHGGVVPPYFEESRRYEPPPAAGGEASSPAPPDDEEGAAGEDGGEDDRGPGSGPGRAGGEDGAGGAPARGGPAPGEPEPRADADRPEGWPSLDAITRPPGAPAAPAAPAGATLPVGVGAGIAAAVIACAAAAAAGAYFVRARRRGAGPLPKKAKTLPPFGNIGYSALPG
ncbi:envelope glycoprotein D [Cervid alphaherpesvirus 1]|uniref:Glycoprotein D n=2 Tax=Cervid alphaherpesvirus 1 TaxID=79891 RepID=Q2LDY4_9ALPH|nr:envelope glycoprotein D [Cervid alphaherpesvirus 1]ABC59437.1 glycoprotein D [Cervid alphaherpesvirus 1]AVT50718.1 envelope glycoprotein D [Cervid alphaherpesvirus 1]